ncbi:hypothetical protein OC844_004466 [Tilletia horrida]|nr:hypothetical protein OC844_004466 [Tilletia horrida]
MHSTALSAPLIGILLLMLFDFAGRPALAFDLNIVSVTCDANITWTVSLTYDEFINGTYWSDYVGSPSNTTSPTVGAISDLFSDWGVNRSFWHDLTDSTVDKGLISGPGQVKTFLYTFSVLDANNETIPARDGTVSLKTLAITLPCGVPSEVVTLYPTSTMLPPSISSPPVSSPPVSSPPVSSPSSTPSFGSTPPRSNSQAGVIGGAVGGVIAAGIVAVLLFTCRRRRQRHNVTNVGAAAADTPTTSYRPAFASSSAASSPMSEISAAQLKPPHAGTDDVERLSPPTTDVERI